MTKIVAIIGGALLMAGVATAGTVSSLGSSDDGTIGSTLPTASVTTDRQDDRGREREVRGREGEARGRTAEPDEDLRGPCDEAEHANDPRCTGTTATARATTTARSDDDHHGRNRGRGGGDDGRHGGHGGHGGDD